MPAPNGDKEYKFERDGYVPESWFDEARGLIGTMVAYGDHGLCGNGCWKCKAERFLESL